MCEVTKDNFEEVLPKILEDIRKCDFIAFDSEFSAVNISEENRFSLFDSMNERYGKLRDCARNTFICQMGVALFKHDLSVNTFSCSVYNVFICPKSFGPVDPYFVWTSSSIRFLSENGFDFNKFAQKGIGCLNEGQKKLIQDYLKTGGFARATQRNVSFKEEDVVKDLCTRISQWIPGRKIGEEKSFDIISSEEEFFVHQDIRSKFYNIWSYHTSQSSESGLRMITVKIVSPEERKQLESRQENEKAVEAIITELSGFTAVIEAMIQNKKPIVGHNCFSDLIRIYQQFIRDLPQSYCQFKSDLNHAFPSVFDTKHLSFHIRRKSEHEKPNLAKLFRSTNLEELYLCLSDPECKFYTLNMPKIVMDDNKDLFKLNYEGSSRFHEAGFDAYITGYCFIKICHLNALLNKWVPIEGVLPFSQTRMSVHHWENQVNIPRAAVPYINLTGTDPESSRPPLLLIRDKRGRPINHVELAEQLSRHGSVDVRQHSKCEILVAVNNFTTSKNILAAFRNSANDFTVVKYNVLRHGKTARSLLRISGYVFLMSICAASIIIPLQSCRST